METTNRETTNRETISLDTIDYYVDTLPDNAKMLIQHIQIIDDNIHRYLTEKGIAELAKENIVSKLSRMKDEFEVAENENEETEDEETEA